MSAYNDLKIKAMKENIEETKSFLDDILNEYESNTKLLAEIISKPESERVEELKEQLHQVKTETAELMNKYEEYAAPYEIDYMFEKYIEHIKDTGTTMYHKPKWMITVNPLGTYRTLECTCGQRLYNGSVF